jgi:hypothetical protein
VTLQELAAAINAEHQGVLDSSRRGLEHARRAGEYLAAAKDQVPRGGWGPWLQANCPRVNERSDRVYRRITAEWETVWQCATIAEALRVLAEALEPADSADFNLTAERVGRTRASQPPPLYAIPVMNEWIALLRGMPADHLSRHDTRESLVKLRAEIDAVLARGEQ